ncbi:MAG: hypothetical protein COV76_08150 [Candidatus Omnitrophica bacterium CG11_big_fil_rev_8_21_14_0_20_64_10]|nr:MAG: hypothetical protein COV76_08150 [Candidatus Omnitrophica bacterium CG11_big_fil_rev_8_21_14_0_20_64_10]
MFDFGELLMLKVVQVDSDRERKGVQMKMNRVALGVLAVWGVIALALSRPIPSATAAVPLLMVDNFDGPGGLTNMLDNRASTFVKAPSKVMVSVLEDAIEGKKTRVLMIRYEKKQTGGPFDGGGWAGYYTLVKSPGAVVAPTLESPTPEPAEDKYLDASGYKMLTFLVRGETGAENFVIGLSDQHWDQVGDSVKSQEIGKYLPAGKLTTEWQEAMIPLDEFFLDHTRLSGIAVVFDGGLFPVAGSAGKIYLDDIALE